MVELIINANKIVKEPIRRRDWHNYFINFLEGLIPRVSEAHCEYTSLHEYVITIEGQINFLILFIIG